MFISVDFANPWIIKSLYILVDFTNLRLIKNYTFHLILLFPFVYTTNEYIKLVKTIVTHVRQFSGPVRVRSWYLRDQ